MSDPEPPAADSEDAPPSSPYDGLPDRAAKAMRTLELVISAMLLTVFLAMQVVHHTSTVSSVAPVEAGSLDSVEGWVSRQSALIPLGLGLGTLALVFAFSFGAPLLRALRDGLRRQRPSTLPLGHFLLVFGVLILVPGMALLGLPRATLTVERGPTATLAKLEASEGGRTLAFSPGKPLGFGEETLPLDDGGPVLLHREQLATWLVVPEEAPPVSLDGERVEAGATVQVVPGAALEVGPYRAVYRAPAPRETLGAIALGQVLGLVVLLLGCRVFGGAGYLGRVGLTGEGWLGEVWRGIAAWCAFLPIYVGAVIAGLLLAKLVGFTPTGHSLIRMLEREGLGLAALVVCQAVVLAPILEEIQFRGFLLQGFSRPLGYPAALVLSALAFGCIHEGLGALLPMMALGLLFGGLVLSSPNRSLVGAITAHALHNGATIGIVVLLVTVS